jgi:hypothetical protein
MQHNNLSLTKKISDMLDLKQNQKIEDVSPILNVVLQVSPPINFFKSLNDSSANFYTIPTDRDFYLVGLTISSAHVDDATSVDYLTITLEDGTTQNLAVYCASFTTNVPNSVFGSWNFNEGIKLKAGSTLSFSRGSSVSYITMWGKIIETRKTG